MNEHERIRNSAFFFTNVDIKKNIKKCNATNESSKSAFFLQT